MGTTGSTGKPAQRARPAQPNPKEENKMTIELKQNMDELKLKLEHLRSFL